MEPIKITPATLPEILSRANSSAKEGDTVTSTSSAQEKKDIRSFNDLLNSFPMIARQMQTGLERVFKEFHTEVKSYAEGPRSPRLSRRHSGASSQSGSNGSIHSKYSHRHVKSPSIATRHVEEEEDHLRRALEAAVTAAIDLFQLVDKQQLSFLGSSTDLTGPMVERLIERYVTEQLHDSSLFPLLRDSRKLEDLELESCIHQMQHVDVSQVGISIDDNRQGKEQMMQRLRRGVEEFRKLGVAGSPQEMMDILLSTQKLVTGADPSINTTTTTTGNELQVTEKPQSNMTMNADTLVSLLLIVVIRSQVRHLHARLTYMKNFLFIDDVESGEMGYALSTFEAVLSYLASDSGGLRKASRRNKRLWQATKTGNMQELKAIIEPSRASSRRQSLSPASKKAAEDTFRPMEYDSLENGAAEHDVGQLSERRFSEASTQRDTFSEGSTLAHVFPFQANTDNGLGSSLPRKSKRVSMDMGSLSISSGYSALSRSNTADSRASAFEGDTSIATLMQTQDARGESLLMMAVEFRQTEVLGYFLSLEDYFPLNTVLEDSNSEGTTLLSAAVQLADTELIEEVLQCVLQAREEETISVYLNRSDNRGRTVAHYLFNAPYLIPRLGEMLPWRKKDKNGQTPLLALCRSYDHPNYLDMVNDALHFATIQQGDGQPLHLDIHVDGKGNSILHVINSPSIAMRVLRHCDSDANAANDKKFTPLMVASKYGRTDMVRAFFGDQRVDVAAKELRGMTAVELAKDDEVRNRIDDMVLVSNVPAADGRVTSVVRSFFVEDASIRLIIKSAVRNDNGMIGVTTCRRSLADFENLAKWLSLEHPASWLPSIFNFRSPFQIPSKPSRAALQDIQIRLDRFLKIMLSHSTFSTHELLWEFILFPEIQPDMMAERSRKKAEIRSENIRDEYEPIDDVKDVESFVGYARETLRPVHHSTRSVLRRVTSIQNCSIGRCHLSSSTCKNLPFDRFFYCARPWCRVLKDFHLRTSILYRSFRALCCMLPHSRIGPFQIIPSGSQRYIIHNHGYLILSLTTPFPHNFHEHYSKSHRSPCLLSSAF